MMAGNNRSLRTDDWKVVNKSDLNQGEKPKTFIASELFSLIVFQSFGYSMRPDTKMSIHQ